MASLMGGATYSHGGTFTTGEGENSNVEIELISQASGGQSGHLKGLLAQQISANITTQDRTVYEIGSNKYYRIQGRPSGNGSIQHLVGPNTQNAWIHISDWTSCKAASLKVNVKPSKAKCPENQAVGSQKPIYFTGGFLNSVQVGATAGEVMVTSNLGFTFMDLADAPSS